MLRTFTAVIERCPATGLFIAHVPGNIKEVLELNLLMENPYES